MLKIRSEQMKAFQPVAEAAFVRRVIEHVREHHSSTVIQLPAEVVPLKQVSDEKLYAMVETGIARARAYGMDWESSITAFVVTMFTAGPNFDKHPLIQRVLRDDRVEPNSRMDELWERTSEENWEAVNSKYDPTAWEPHLEGMNSER
jgi:hypothetical protein